MNVKAWQAAKTSGVLHIYGSMSYISHNTHIYVCMCTYTQSSKRARVVLSMRRSRWYHMMYCYCIYTELRFICYRPRKSFTTGTRQLYTRSKKSSLPDLRKIPSHVYMYNMYLQKQLARASARQWRMFGLHRLTSLLAPSHGNRRRVTHSTAAAAQQQWVGSSHDENQPNNHPPTCLCQNIVDHTLFMHSRDPLAYPPLFSICSVVHNLLPCASSLSLSLIHTAAGTMRLGAIHMMLAASAAPARAFVTSTAPSAARFAGGPALFSGGARQGMIMIRMQVHTIREDGVRQRQQAERIDRISYVWYVTQHLFAVRVCMSLSWTQQ